MDSQADPGDPPRVALERQQGSYVFHELITHVPLSEDGENEDIWITCVEIWDENLYVGTSAGELLHFVRIPQDPSDQSGEANFILASRLQPATSQADGPGVEQILLLPTVGKACIVCNSSLTFYSLPELTPAFRRLDNCSWVGGLDQNAESREHDSDVAVIIMVCLKSRIRLIQIGDEARKVRDIQFGGCLAINRKDSLACVADAHSYAMLDVVQQQKVPLFPISSVDEEASASIGGAAEDISALNAQRPARSSSLIGALPRPMSSDGRRGSHERSTSLGTFGNGPGQQQRGSFLLQSSPRKLLEPPGTPRRPTSSQSGALSPERASSPAPRAPTPDKPLPATPDQQIEHPSTTPELLKPHIASPSANEFLLTTGTTKSDPGVGMFVNLEGDVVPRGTIEFSRYPEVIVIDGQGIDPSASVKPGELPEEGFVLAVVQPLQSEDPSRIVEVQRWDMNPSEGGNIKETMRLPFLDRSKYDHVGIRKVCAKNSVQLIDVRDKMRLRRMNLRLSNKKESRDERQQNEKSEAREKEEMQFAIRLSQTQTQLVSWSGSNIWWTVRNSLVMKLDAKLELARLATPDEITDGTQKGVKNVLNDIRGQEPRTELEFLGLNYIRQKASLLLFTDLLIRTAAGTIVPGNDKRIVEESLITGDVDPRIIMALLPVLRDEVEEGPQGIWFPSGLKELVEGFLQVHDLAGKNIDVNGPYGDNVLPLIKRYLLHWRRKKGFGSIPDEADVFKTVDAALLHTLLIIDSNSPRGQAIAGSTRSELNSVVDSGIDCFDRGVELLEQYHRLYVLSRLYQSRRISPKVLGTWKRILENEQDDGGEFTNGEQEVRRYIGAIRDTNLIKEYGCWLADRNPSLGVRVFADDNSRVKFEPSDTIALLKEKAPGAVKHFLEHLVFGKNLAQYANDLIFYYLSTVTNELSAHSESRTILLQTYETYRALKPPKPTYRTFITENALGTDWWDSRLRLLQLLGGHHAAASKYDVTAIFERLEPYSQELVPEMIILNGRQGRHTEAIRLLTHGLGDFDTAISYCLLGGSSIFRPALGERAKDTLPSHEVQAVLFNHLLDEFLRIEDLQDRIERTAELLERFGGWFDIERVLGLIPDTWSIDIVAGFLVHALRRIVHDRSETQVTRYLRQSENLRISADLIDKIEEIGPTVDRGEELEGPS
ncbi:MAG: hypothetical protein M1820_005087 [Bogoriella megaspora]|nr:MAG: hypothetical protein M1820_005087 [Bogoriella megaspora]